MPTISRPSLRRAIASVVDQLEDEDVLIVVGDGPQNEAEAVCESFQPANLTYAETFHPGSVFGNAQRTFAMELAADRSSHVCFLDDDDVYVHGALDRIRASVSDASDAAHIFRAEWGPGHHWQGVLWADREVRESNFGTCQVVLPNRHYPRKWMDGNERGTVSDYAWMSAAIGECDGVCWHEDVVAVVRP